jgi:hypothetical protein
MDDLQWDSDLPLFVVGGLQVGLGAFNLEGCREGANKVALRVIDILGSAQNSRNRTVVVNQWLDIPTNVMEGDTRTTLKVVYICVT